MCLFFKLSGLISWWKDFFMLGTCFRLCQKLNQTVAFCSTKVLHTTLIIDRFYVVLILNDMSLGSGLSACLLLNGRSKFCTFSGVEKHERKTENKQCVLKQQVKVRLKGPHFEGDCRLFFSFPQRILLLTAWLEIQSCANIWAPYGLDNLSFYFVIHSAHSSTF